MISRANSAPRILLGDGMTKVLLTGGAGFIGHHVISYILERTDWAITIVDRLDFSGNLNRIAAVLGDRKNRVRWVYHDLRAPISPQLTRQIGYHDYILHLGALTHVDRAIAEPLAAVMDNVVGTANILEFARDVGCLKFVYFSTDEVFGPASADVAFNEWDRYNSTNPYSATKAGGEELTLAYHNTYGVPAFITHTMNVFGERQHPEKFIPSTIAKVLRGDTVLIHADKSCSQPGSRFYIHASDVASALLFLLKRENTAGDKYNIVGSEEIDNRELAFRISAILDKRLSYKMIDFHSSRPGHDLRYALSGQKMEKMGWRPNRNLNDGLTQTVLWTAANPEWLS